MITVVIYGETYECSKAVKGNDFVILYDEAGNEITSFNGIGSFDGYEISGGDWSTPEPTLEERQTATDAAILALMEVMG